MTSTYNKVVAECNINMNQKQNNKFVLGRLYPQYFKLVKQANSTIQQYPQPKINKSNEQKKIESKLKAIIYNLERQLQEQALMSKPKLRRNDSNQHSIHSKASVRSYSQKSLNLKSHSNRCYTELQPTEESQNTQRSQMQTRLKKRAEKNRQSEVLILPKLKLNSNIGDQVERKQLLSKTKRKKLELLEEHQHKLGKIVLQKVQEHFEKQKEGRKHYYERVKSEQGIDQSFVTYLRNKVKKANIALGP